MHERHQRELMKAKRNKAEMALGKEIIDHLSAASRKISRLTPDEWTEFSRNSTVYAIIQMTERVNHLAGANILKLPAEAESNYLEVESFELDQIGTIPSFLTD